MTTDITNIILTGPPGTGKSAVGVKLSELLGRSFVDMDEELEHSLGCNISDYFFLKGEESFRDVESELCVELSLKDNLIIATGGGTLMRRENKNALETSGVFINLVTSPDEILNRLRRHEDRPLLSGNDATRKLKLEKLLAERKKIYDAIPIQVETAELKPKQIARKILSILSIKRPDISCEEITDMQSNVDELNPKSQKKDSYPPDAHRLEVTGTSKTYPIIICKKLLKKIGQELLEITGKPCDVAIVTNKEIGSLYKDIVIAGLKENGFKCKIIFVPEGEQNKNLSTVNGIYKEFLKMNLTRDGIALALGGGVVGDMTGFAAATYLRGIGFVQVPTSLLAMVDASVGGKTGVDLDEGKNLVGAFKQPLAVFMDPVVLNTLPQKELSSGTAEVIKHALIGNKKLFEKFEECDLSYGEIILEAVKVKISIVEQDPFEKGVRAHLNLGHTFGHAIELLSNFSWRHGEAVGVGLVAASHLAVILGKADAGLPPRIIKILKKYNLPTTIKDFNTCEILKAMKHDKKRSERKLRFIIPLALGQVDIIENPEDKTLRKVLNKIIVK